MTALLAQRPQAESDAIHVIANPTLYASRPSVLRNAWLVLMTQRGRPVVQHRLAQMPAESAND